MFEKFDRGNHDQYAIDGLVARADNRSEIDQTDRNNTVHEAKIAALADAEHLWHQAGFDEDFHEMEQTLGSTWVYSRKYPLISVASFPSRDVVARPVQLGARQIACSRIFDEDDVVDGMAALYGRTLFYRTKIAQEDEEDETYQDRGFFSFIAQIRDKDGLFVPHVMFGDVDAAQWQDSPLKALFVHTVLEEREPAKAISFDDIGQSLSLLQLYETSGQDTNIRGALSRTVKRKLLGGHKVEAGVFRQNQTPFVGDDTALRQVVRTAMQEFIDSYVEPSQTIESVPQEADRRAELGRLVHESTRGVALTEFDIAHAGLRAQRNADKVSPHRDPRERVIKPKLIEHIDVEESQRQLFENEADFPFIQLLQRTMPVGFSPYSNDYLMRDLLGHLREEKLRKKLFSTTLTAQDKETIRSNHARRSPLERTLDAGLGWSPDKL